MEFEFSINDILREPFTALDKAAVSTLSKSSILSQKLTQILDKLGEASAKAQALPGAITTAFKLLHSDHKLYVLKDDASNNGLGAALGYIRVGRKKLFVFDQQSRQHEMEPLCVLDFYVHESRQRQGHGKQLFEYMLQAESIRPCHLAIDRPSSKFVSFLQKHYGLRQTVQQVNNFAVFEGFFNNRPDADRKFGKSLRRGHESSSAVCPPAASATVSSGTRGGGGSSQLRDTSAVAAAAAPAGEQQQRLPPLGRAAAVASISAAAGSESDFLRNVKPQRSPWEGADVGDRADPKQAFATAPKNLSTAEPMRAGGDAAPGMFAQASAYSRHQKGGHSAPAHPSPAPSGKSSGDAATSDYVEPLRNRSGQQPKDVSAMTTTTGVLNAHREAYNGQGHLKLKPLGVPEKAEAVGDDRLAHRKDTRYQDNLTSNVQSTGTGHANGPPTNPSLVGQVSKRTEDTTWSLFGVPSAANYSRTRHQLARPF